MKFDISAMLNPKVYNHPVKHLELMQTHISWVLLTGDFAYKIKKPVNYGFLDFSSLEKRRQFCEQELLLNRRLAPTLYLDVVPVTGTYDNPIISGNGKAFEYAVKMAQFPQSAQLDNMLAAGELNIEHMDAIARMVADFHQTIQVANDSVEYGSKRAIYQPVEENFKQINAHLNVPRYSDTLKRLRQWCKSSFEKLESILEQRKRDGFVRECHGDMHLRNMIWLDNRPMAFDCIEFNPQLSWIDVISEVAFLVMDLQGRQQHKLANRFLNSYLEVTGDYAGLLVLAFYLCYRALVRAKVDALRLDQGDIAETEKMQSLAEFESYLELATGYTRQTHPKLIIMHGVSASGKSTLSRQLTDAMDLIRIRSDIERKRLFGITATESAASEINTAIYSAQSSQQTYSKLAELAADVITAGYSVVVDAAFLQYEQREQFQQLAGRIGIPYIILETTTSSELLRQRIVDRKRDVSDAGLAVLEHQISNLQPLHKEEAGIMISINTDRPVDIDALIQKL